MSDDLRKRVERGRHGARSGAHGRIRQFQATVCGPKLSGQGRVEPVLEQSGCCPQCHIPEMQTGYIHMRIGNSLGIVTTDVLAQTQVKAEGRVQPGLFRFWDVSEGRKPTAQGAGSVRADKPMSKKSSNTDGRRVPAGFDSRNGFRC
ncbi:hypothetical protein [Brucella tritici]|uniref:Uncharacterized protein n=1 Tax=Brucella tritici TaxID=94626 RepID=A0A6L3YYG8_9HYPH|nr:hypothetical protein [Brucella tritici]KAB2690244.1 hypothetical protein F9L08_01910 [Brucella tritici]